MTPGQVVEVGRNDCAVPPGTRGVWLGVVPETGNALVLLAGGRRVALTAEQWRPEGGAWAEPRTLAGEPLPPPARRSPRRVGCEVPGCDAPHEAHGLCVAHWMRRRRHGDVRAEVPVGQHRRGKARACSVDGCDSPHKALGLCRTHYQRLLRHGDVMADVPVGQRTGRVAARPTCSVAGCDRSHHARGLCQTHYARAAHRPVGADLSADRPRPTVCAVDGCAGRPHARGYCRMHYSRLMRLGDPGEAA